MSATPMSATPEFPSTQAKAWRTRLVGTPLGWVITLALAALGAYLLATHGRHVLSALPYLLLMACPLMHLFMQSGHRHGNSR